LTVERTSCFMDLGHVSFINPWFRADNATTEELAIGLLCEEKMYKCFPKESVNAKRNRGARERWLINYCEHGTSNVSQRKVLVQVFLLNYCSIKQPYISTFIICHHTDNDDGETKLCYSEQITHFTFHAAMSQLPSSM